MNDWKQRLGMVYSTNPDFEYTVEQEAQEETLEPSKQDLRVWIDRKHRGGKTVTLIKGFVGREEDLAELGRMLKSKCGEIIIQGDHRERVVELLLKAGYRCKKAGN